PGTASSAAARTLSASLPVSAFSSERTGVAPPGFPAGGCDGLVADGCAVEPDELLSSADAVRLLAEAPPAPAPAANSPARLSSLLRRRGPSVGWFSCIVFSSLRPPSDDGVETMLGREVLDSLCATSLRVNSTVVSGHSPRRAQCGSAASCRRRSSCADC